VLISSRCHLRLAGEDCEADIRTLSVRVSQLIDVVIMKIVHLNSFGFAFPEVCVFLTQVMSATKKTRLCWRQDLSEFRGLTEQERTGFLLVLEWFENFRMRHELEAGRESAKIFWRTEVLREDRQREKWSRKAAPRDHRVKLRHAITA
jgi:hypothetical protein